VDQFISEEPRSSTIVNSFDAIGFPVLEFKAEKTGKQEPLRKGVTMITSADMKPQKSTSKKKKSKIENAAEIAEQVTTE